MSQLVDARGVPFASQAPYQHKKLERDLAGIDRPSFIKLGNQFPELDLSSFSRKRVFLVSCAGIRQGQIHFVEPPKKRPKSRSLAHLIHDMPTVPTTVMCNPGEWDALRMLLEHNGAIVENRDDPCPYEAIEID